MRPSTTLAVLGARTSIKPAASARNVAGSGVPAADSDRGRGVLGGSGAQAAEQRQHDDEEHERAERWSEHTELPFLDASGVARPDLTQTGSTSGAASYPKHRGSATPRTRMDLH